CSPILTPAGTDSIMVRFRPDRLGTYGAVLAVSSSDSSSPVVHVLLTGVCAENTVPRIAVSRRMIDFGEVNVGLVKDEDVTIFNTGAADLLIQRMDFLGLDTADFSIVLPPSPIIPLGDSSLLRLRLTASSGGPRSAFLRIQTNDPVNVYTDVMLSGTVVGTSAVPPAPAFTVFPPYPNPFSSRTTVVVEARTRCSFTLDVLDVLGRCVHVLHEGILEPGHVVFAWDGMGADGKRAAPGVYRVIADAGGKRLSSTVVLLPLR
ncbi:MAG: choice-of-anchor D domain-containing protein, partial [Bacteroidota bacterium]|nr:choice-of-anchor D domain-containing protein [Bacteroidota bacterium]